METQEVVHAPVTGTPDPLALIKLAIDTNADIDKLEKLMALKERHDAAQARREFFEALARFQAECPVITKNKKADFNSSKGNVKYSFATLDQIVSQIKDPLQKCDLTYRWEFSENENRISVTCLITHKSGHSETTVTSANADTSGAKNEIQARGSTLTYLQRYTLIGALGIATAQEDIDGQNKNDGKLHPDTELAIKDCKTEADLSSVWNSNTQLHTDKAFVQAMGKRKMEIKKTATNGKSN